MCVVAVAIVSRHALDGPAATAEKEVSLDGFLKNLRLDLLISAKFGTRLPTINGNDLAPVVGVLTRRFDRMRCLRVAVMFVCRRYKSLHGAHCICIQGC